MRCDEFVGPGWPAPVAGTASELVPFGARVVVDGTPFGVLDTGQPADSEPLVLNLDRLRADLHRLAGALASHGAAKVYQDRALGALCAIEALSLELRRHAL